MNRVAVLTFPLLCGTVAADLVRIVVDMNPDQPGYQSTIRVPAGTTRVRGVGVYIERGEGAPRVHTIGYIGAIDRGIVFGHNPSDVNFGSVTAIHASPGSPANPGNSIGLTPGYIPWFSGPEVNYLEYGAAGPALISPSPLRPSFTIDIDLAGAAAGDVFSFYLLDAVAANWGGGRGAFTSGSGVMLDAGGDCTPDLTATNNGNDPDDPVPSPPAPYRVDLIDGGIGPATISVVLPCPADFNQDGGVDGSDVEAFFVPWHAGLPVADVNNDGGVDGADVEYFFRAWEAGGCE